MTNVEATTTENAAAVAEQGAHVAPEKASSKKGGSQKKGARQSQGRSEEGSQGWQDGRKTRPRERSPPAARREQGGEDPGADRAVQRGDAGRNRKSHGLAKTFDPGISLDRR